MKDVKSRSLVSCTSIESRILYCLRNEKEVLDVSVLIYNQTTKTVDAEGISLEVQTRRLSITMILTGRLVEFAIVSAAVDRI